MTEFMCERKAHSICWMMHIEEHQWRLPWHLKCHPADRCAAKIRSPDDNTGSFGQGREISHWSGRQRPMGAHNRSDFLRRAVSLDIQGWQIGWGLEINGVEKSPHLHRSDVKLRRHHVE